MVLLAVFDRRVPVNTRIINYSNKFQGKPYVPTQFEQRNTNERRQGRQTDRLVDRLHSPITSYYFRKRTQNPHTLGNYNSVL